MPKNSSHEDFFYSEYKSGRNTRGIVRAEERIVHRSPPLPKGDSSRSLPVYTYATDTFNLLPFHMPPHFHFSSTYVLFSEKYTFVCVNFTDFCSQLKQSMATHFPDFKFYKKLSVKPYLK